MDEMWHSHPATASNFINDMPSGFNHFGESNGQSGDRASFEIMSTLPPTAGKVPKEANVFLPSRNLRLIYNAETFKSIENYK